MPRRTYDVKGTGYLILDFVARGGKALPFGPLVPYLARYMPQMSHRQIKNKAFYVIRALNEDGMLDDTIITALGWHVLDVLEHTEWST